MKVLLVN